ncbi:hypothetical protein DAPPUDRAFT_337747 [Daphnia pulex]|uniref:Tudor domain-containing protein n=1 Tax=Daphnia pulex TaxID=6669 RepID=E9I224_DAPPU|nr:hypothetical protein DAPPUDRAFT_337747 [Daphnia pulex]|eukprot:EFX61956.1 hypothetical protein DAPPUDRAFT_337747 [Daphnia pulex]
MADTLIYVTHIEDSMELQGPCLYFWGTLDNNLYLLMERFLETFRSFLERTYPPPSVNVLAGNGICCVLIGHQWYRARVTSLILDDSGKLKVLCIDNGKTHSVPLSSVRTLGTAIPGSIAKHIRKWRPLSTKFILADVSAPIVPGCSNRQWSAAALTFLKRHVQNQTWKAALLGAYGEHLGVRLFDSNNQLLAKYLVDQKLGVAAQTYKDAITMCEELKKSDANCLLPKICPTEIAVPPTVSSTAKVSLESSSKPHKNYFSSRSYLTSKLPEEGRHDVVVSNMANGPYKFVIRLTREEETLQNLRKALDSVAPHPFPGSPKEGAPCIAVCPADNFFHRCVITAVDESGHQPLPTVYFVDTGFEYQLSLPFICAIPNELLALPPFAYQMHTVSHSNKLTSCSVHFHPLDPHAVKTQKPKTHV